MSRALRSHLSCTLARGSVGWHKRAHSYDDDMRLRHTRTTIFRCVCWSARAQVRTMDFVKWFLCSSSSDQCPGYELCSRFGVCLFVCSHTLGAQNDIPIRPGYLRTTSPSFLTSSRLWCGKETIYIVMCLCIECFIFDYVSLMIYSCADLMGSLVFNTVIIWCRHDSPHRGRMVFNEFGASNRIYALFCVAP